MKERDDEAMRLWRDLIESAVKRGEIEVPPVAASFGTDKAAASGLRSIAGSSGALGGPVFSLLNQAAPKAAGTGWLKWVNPIAGLISLFSGGKKDTSEEPAAPAITPRPPKRRIEYGLVESEGGSLYSTDRDERGRSRLAAEREGGPSQVLVQIQAMDSRSFLDHRDEIASAVRQALMESHGLGSVLDEFRE
jgi:hypothetical protein